MIRLEAVFLGVLTPESLYRSWRHSLDGDGHDEDAEPAAVAATPTS